jgi:hypothetical protein
MNPIQHMITVGHNAGVCIQVWRLKEREDIMNLQSEGDMQCDT